MTNIIISILARLLAIPPLFFLFCSVFRTYWDKRHNINGLRKTRLVLLLLFLTLLVDNLVFLYFAFIAFVNNKTITLTFFALIFDKLCILFGIYGLFFLFRHASKKE